MEYDLSVDENEKKNREVTDETVDEKRIRFAKMIINKAKTLKNKEQNIEDRDDYIPTSYIYY